jgi:hypothetical protein
MKEIDYNNPQMMVISDHGEFLILPQIVDKVESVFGWCIYNSD